MDFVICIEKFDSILQFLLEKSEICGIIIANLRGVSVSDYN